MTGEWDLTVGTVVADFLKGIVQPQKWGVERGTAYNRKRFLGTLKGLIF